MADYDYLLVGQGIAGTTLAFQLLKKGRKVMVLNDSQLRSSSRAAGGIVNPITGRKMKKTWKADQLFPYLFRFYRDLEQATSATFLHEMPIYRPFFSIEEQNEWIAKFEDEPYRAYISEARGKSLSDGCVSDEFGGLLLKMCGWIDVPVMLDRFKAYLLEKRAFQEEHFDENLLEFHSGEIKYKDIKAKRIIYCDGQLSAKSKFFGWLPFRPVKGELLHIKPEKSFDKIYNRGVFILPPVEGVSKVGATYNWKDLGPEPTEEARQQLKDKLEALMEFEYEIVNQTTGVRPATKDRRPFIGQHPEQASVFVFNGLGTKGLSLAPYFSEQLVNYLEEGEELDQEVNINRYFSLY